MSTFVVNGQTVTAEKNKKLLRFLRDDLGLTSVKDGCSEGACGACTVIIDGVTCKACVPDTDRLEGRNIVTVEGLSDWEKEMYTFAYGEAGALYYVTLPDIKDAELYSETVKANENNLNQNFTAIAQKIEELETRLSALE